MKECDKVVTERDFRREEFKHSDPKDYEFRKDGAIVRKDRWEFGIRNIAGVITGDAKEFEIKNLVYTVKWLMDQVPDLERDV